MFESNETLKNIVQGQQALQGQQTPSPLEQLKDIKPLLEIPDNSYYIFLGLVIVGSLLLLGVLFFAVKRLLKLRRENLAKKYLAQLHAIDWVDTKQSAYSATHYARLLATDTRRQELFEQLVPMLDRYKYKKEVERVDEETRRQLNLFVQVCDESV